MTTTSSARRAMRRRHARHLATAALAVAAAACMNLGSGPHTPSPLGATSPAGEWVDVRRSTPTDTSVWVLTPGGSDELLTVHLDATGAPHVIRRLYGRWHDGRITGASGAPVTALCFTRRPGRDARSCNPYVLDSVRIDGAMARRLSVTGYAGTHTTGDRVLLERTHHARNGGDVTAPPPGPAQTASSGHGGYRPRSVQPERPSVATHAGTVAAGYAELETGIQHDRASDGTAVTQVPSLVKLGLTKRTQLSIVLPTVATTGAPFGVGDVSVGIKWRVTEDRPTIQDVAILPGIKIPSGGPRGTGTTDFSLLLINSRVIGPVALDLNLGATWRSGDGTQAPRSSSLWAAAAGIPVHGAFGWAVECFGLPGTSGPAGSAPIVALLTGPTYELRPELALDFGIITPISGPQPHSFYLGMVTSIGRFVRP